MTPKRCDVVLIPFPFSDLSQWKRRPVLVLTEIDFFGDFLAVAITSQSGHNDNMAILAADFSAGKLPSQSWVRSTRLFFLNKNNAVALLGRLKPNSFLRIHREVCQNLGCIRQ
ncbi:type II toxin-antitoxin system PemK/MazF family toxin [Methylomagnum sp.]